MTILADKLKAQEAVLKEFNRPKPGHPVWYDHMAMAEEIVELRERVALLHALNPLK